MSVETRDPDPGEPLSAAHPPAGEATADVPAPAGASAGGPTRATKRQGRHRRAAGPLLVACCYLACAWAVTAHLWADSSGSDALGGNGDIDLFAWFLRYAATAVAHGHLPALVTTGMNAPHGINLMWNTSFLLPGVLLTPLTLLAGPQVSLTLVLTLGFAGSAASLYWVLRRWGASIGAAALGGAVYAFSPAMMSAGTSHYHLQFAVLPPLIIDALLRLVTGRGHSVRGGAWLGLLCAVQLFIGEELLVYTAIAAVILTAAIAASRLGAVRQRARFAVTGLAAAGAVFGIFDGYALWVQLAGPLAEHSKLLVSLVTNPTWFVTPSARILLHTRASAAATPSLAHPAAENLNYLGWPLIGVLVIAAAMFWRDVRVRAAAVTWVALELCALGGGPLHLAGVYKWPGRLLPWHWLQGLPLVAQVLPWRFSLLADGAAAAVLAFSLDRALAAVRSGDGWRDWQGWQGLQRGALIVVAVLAVLPLVPLPYQAVRLTQVPAGWQATFTRLQLPPDAPVLTFPFPSGASSDVLRWQADTGQPSSMIGGYFIGPGPRGQAAFFFSVITAQTRVAAYLNQLWKGRHPSSLPDAELRAVIGSWRTAAIVAVTSPQSPVASVLTRLFGRPAFHIGNVLTWRLRPAPP